MGIEVLIERQAKFIQEVITATWKSDFSHLDLELFQSPAKLVKAPIKRGPNKRTWLAATKDFRSIRLDIFTIDIELVAPSSIQEKVVPKKRKANHQGSPTKR